jgi:hypothetical protein
VSTTTNQPQYDPEPPHTWTRKDFDLRLLAGLSSRERAEKETDRDLVKPIEQLLCDVHDMAERIEQGGDLASKPIQAMLHAQKRMVSMMAKVALSNDRLAWRMEVLTWVVTALAALSAILSLIQAAAAIRSWPQ